MTQEPTCRRNIRSTVGTALLLIGSTALVAYSAALAWQFQAALNSTGIDSLGCFGSIGLASLQAVRIVALDHTVLLSVMYPIFVLYSALIVTLIGNALLWETDKGGPAPGPRDVPA